MINKFTYRYAPIAEKNEVLIGESVKKNQSLKFLGFRDNKTAFENPRRYRLKNFKSFEIQNIHEHRDIFLKFISKKFEILQFAKEWGFLSSDYKSVNFSDSYRYISINKKKSNPITEEKTFYHNKLKINQELLYEFELNWKIEQNFIFNLVNIINCLHLDKFEDFFSIIKNDVTTLEDKSYKISTDFDSTGKYIEFKNSLETNEMVNAINLFQDEVNSPLSFSSHRQSQAISNNKIYINRGQYYKNDFSKEDFSYSGMDAIPNDENDTYDLNYQENEETYESNNIISVPHEELKKILLKFVSKIFFNYSRNISYGIEADELTGEPTEGLIVRDLKTLICITAYNFYKSHTPLEYCKNCEEPFTKPMLGGNKAQTFCSDKCRYSMQYKNEQLLRKSFEEKGFFVHSLPSKGLNRKLILNPTPSSLESNAKVKLKTLKLADFIAFTDKIDSNEISRYLTGNKDLVKANKHSILLIEHVTNIKKFNFSTDIKETIIYYSNIFGNKFTYCLSNNETFAYFFVIDEQIQIAAFDKILSQKEILNLFIDKFMNKSINKKLTDNLGFYFLDE